MLKPPTYQDVLDAARRIEGHANKTPLLTSNILDDLCGARVFLKAENLQRTGSFKFRGAMNSVTAYLEQTPDLCLLYTSPSPRDQRGSRMPSSA